MAKIKKPIRPPHSPEEIDARRKDASSQASAVARQLAFAGLGVIWLIKPSSGNFENESFNKAPLLLQSLETLISALAVDFLQYVWLAFGWWLASACYPKFSKYVGFPGTCLFFIKMSFLIIGFGILGYYIWVTKHNI